MADTIIATANEAKQWDDKVFLEYMRENEFSEYMGTDENMPIQVKENLIKKPGDAVTISLIGRLSNGNIGTGQLEGNEEQLDNYGHQINLGVVRNAFVINNFEEQSTGIDIRDGGRTQLKNWSMDLLRNDVLNALMSINGTNYGVSTNAAMDAWNVDNADRVIYVGAAISGDHSTDLATLGSADNLGAVEVSLARRKARTANPRMQPIRVKGQEEWYLMLCDTYAFRDLKNDATIVAAQSSAALRGAENPIFRAGDIIYDGVICREVPEISNFIDDTNGVWGAGTTANSLKTGGTGSARVGVSFLLGAQAVGIVYGKRLTTTTDTRDYGFVKGFGVEEFRGVEKLLFKTATGKTNPVDHGVVTVFAYAALD